MTKSREQDQTANKGQDHCGDGKLGAHARLSQREQRDHRRRDQRQQQHRPREIGNAHKGFRIQYFIKVRSSTCAVWRRRYSATISARPTATSAAATVMIKNTITWPSRLLLNRENATKARLPALSINSSDI